MYILLVVAGVTATYIAAKIISSIAIFPGQLFARVQNIKNFKPDQEGLHLSFSEEKTKDNRTVQTVTITPLKPSGNVIIIFNGQNATFRNEKKIKTYCQLANDTGHIVIGFDYSGTGLKRITTWSSQALVNDGFHVALQAQELMGKHNALILKGNSLGGGIATKVARQCHDAGIGAYLWNGRSFKSVASVIIGQIRTLHISGHYENIITKQLSTMAQPIISTWLYLTQFEIDVTDDYKSIPSEYKNYYIVRSNKNHRLAKKDDVMIPHCATLESDSVIKEDVKKIIATGCVLEPTDIAYFRSRRKVTSKLSKNAHPMPETELFCRNDMEMSSYDLFRFFSKEYVENHRKNEPTTSSLTY